MIKLRKNFLSIIFILVIALSMALVASMMTITSQSKNNLSAYASPENFSFEKATVRVMPTGYGSISEYNLMSSDESINSGDFVILDNTEAKTAIASGSATSVESQAIHITFGVDSAIRMLQISATFNGRAIYIDNSSNETFEMFIIGAQNEIAYITDQGVTDVDFVDNPEGEYVFKYQYRTANNGVSTPISGEFSFRLISKENYELSNLGGDLYYTNFMYNTCAVNALNTQDNFVPSSHDTAFNYFNFNNNFTSDQNIGLYLGTSSSAEYQSVSGNINLSTRTLQYPTLKYDVTKYNLSWTKIIQNKTTTVSSELQINEDNSALLTLTTTYAGSTNNQTIEIQNIIENPFVEIRFTEIGTYNFTLNYIVLVSDTNYVVNNNLTPISKQLEIFGYQLKYAQNATGSSELKNDEYGLYGDISVINKNFDFKNLADLTLYANSTSANVYDFIAKTNQAPLWFDFLGSLYTLGTNSYYYIGNTSQITDNASLFSALQTAKTVGSNEYVKNMYFSKAGLYLVEIQYIYGSFSTPFTQYFIFEITNTTPKVYVSYVDDDGQTRYLANEEFINKNITVDWEISSPFNANIRASYTRYDYENTSSPAVANVNIAKGATLSVDGIYLINIYYGNTDQTHLTICVKIDKQAITNYTFYEIDPNDSSNINTAIKDITNKDFRFVYSKGINRANISCEYQTALIIKDNNYVYNDTNNILGASYLLNGYRTTELSAVLNYEMNTVLTTQAIYIFKLTDEAGNTALTYLVYDKTSPAVIFDPSLDNTYNIISDDTTMTVGKYKAISLDLFNTDDILLADFANFNDFASKLNSSLFATYTKNDVDTHLLTVELTTRAWREGLTSDQAIASTDIKNLINSSISLDLTMPNDEIDDYFYYITIRDQANNAYETLIEYNLDNSLVLAFGTNGTNSHRVYNQSATNLNLLYLTYNPENDGYIVDELYYDFYPLTLDKSSPNYPYAQTPTLTQVDIRNSSGRTDYLNSIYSAQIGSEATQVGMYVVTRVYRFDANIFISVDDPNRTKTYTYIVDRTLPIQRVTTDYQIDGSFIRNVGEGLKLLLGTTNYNVVFDQLLLSNQSSPQIILTTDILPVNAIVPFNKYVVLDSEQEYISWLAFNLNLQINWTDTVGTGTAHYGIQSTPSGVLNIPTSIFKRIGNYQFIVTDSTGYFEIDEQSHQITQTNVGANSFVFTIQVTKQSPTASYYGTKNQDGSDKLISSSTSSGSVTPATSDSDLKLVFYDSVDPYKARIENSDISIKFTNINGTVTTVSGIQVSEYDEQSGLPSSKDITNLSNVVCVYEHILDKDGEYQVTSLGEYVYKYTIVLPTTNRYYEGEYNITIHYYGNKEDYYANGYYSSTLSDRDNIYSNYYSSTMNIVLDHTAPTFNLIRLINYDSYLPRSSSDSSVITKDDLISYARGTMVDTAKKEACRQFLRNYTFAIPNDFVFYYATNTSTSYNGENFTNANNFPTYNYSEHDTYSSYYRKYDKYTGNDEQSYIRSDPEFYSDLTKTRFEEGNGRYTNLGYISSANVNANNARSYSFAQKVGNQEGYYEIIEVDLAGNQTIYTVFLKTNDISIAFNDENNTNISESDTNKTVSAIYSTSIQSIYNLDDWTTIQVYDETSGTTLLKSFTITPNSNLDEIISNINELTAYKSNYGLSGALYEIRILKRNTGDYFSVFIQRPGNELQANITEGTINFTITLPTDTSSTKITSFEVYQLNINTSTLVQLYRDLNGEISTTNFSNVRYTFNSGEYYFVLTDNFNRVQVIHYIFGIVDAKDLTYTGFVDTSGDTPVTANEVRFTYQSQLYSVVITRNGTTLDDIQNDENLEIQTLSNGLVNIRFLKEQNQIFDYVITISQSSSTYDSELIEELAQKTEIELEFIMNTNMPSFELIDQSGNSMNYLLTSSGASTSKEIYINWEQAQDYPVTVTINYTNSTGTQTTQIQSGTSIWMEGTYTLTMSNTLENQVSYTFNISLTNAVLFDVYNNEKIITPTLLSHEFIIPSVLDEAKNMKVYMSIYDNFKVVVNEKKDLQGVKVFEDYSKENYGIQIWKISGSTSLYYEEYIALIWLNPDILNLTNFAIGQSEDMIYEPSGLKTTYYNSSAYVTYNGILELSIVDYCTEAIVIYDFIYFDLYYNDTLVGSYTGRIKDETNLSSFTLSQNGVYKLYFKDIAGKNYSFNNNTSSSRYYTVELINNISYLVNGAEPIQNATYNDAVTLQVTNTNRFNSNTFSIKANLNGKEIDPSKYYTKSGWKFSGYGLWQISMSAKINGVLVTTDYSFTILSNKEARQSYSFAKMTNYEIIEVTKDVSTNSILDELKTKYNVQTLTELYLSTENLDFGRYTITVKVNAHDFLPQMQYSYEVWLNEYDVEILSSIPFGGETKSNITLRLNKYAIFQELGNYRIEITGMNTIYVDSDTVGNNAVTTITLNQNQEYFIQLWSESGTLLASYKVTKLEPLNTVAIIIIVVIVLIIAILIFLFVKLRKRMKVR